MNKKAKILGIAPYQGLATLMNQCAHQHPEIELTVMFGNMENGLKLAIKYYKDYDIIISRANTASLISKTITKPVIDIGIDYYDILRCIKIAERTKTKFAVLGFHSLTKLVRTLCDLLNTSIDIFSITTMSEAATLLDKMKDLGYKTVICDAMPYEHAKLIGITPILLTSSVDSINLALNKAVITWHNHHELLNTISLMQQMLSYSSAYYMVFQPNGECIYTTLPENLTSPFEKKFKESLEKYRERETGFFFMTIENQMYSIQFHLSDNTDIPYSIFCVSPSCIPLAHSKYGIQVMDKQMAEHSFLESLYSGTQVGREILLKTGENDNINSSLMITGEVGTGKDRVAHIFYARSPLCNAPMYVVNCAMLNDKSWNFITNHHNSPFTDNGNTIYIANLDTLSAQRQKQLLSIILDTNVHIRNRLMFSCTHPADKKLPHVAFEYTNTLGCILIPVQALREEKEDIASAASLYLNMLNQTTGKPIVGLDDDAVELLRSYDFPHNRTQLKRILKEAAFITSSSYISSSTIAEILRQECKIFKASSISCFPSHEEAKTEATTPPLNLEQSLNDINRDIIRIVLQKCNNNQSATAKKLGISRTTLWRYLNQ